MKEILLATALAATPAVAQDIIQERLPEYQSLTPSAPEPAPRDQAVAADRALLRGLDKLSGVALDLELETGGSAQLGRLSVTLSECRYPEGNPAGDAYAWIEVADPTRDSVLFAGWMVASSPALNPLDHPRYDVWVLRCITS